MTRNVGGSNVTQTRSFVYDSTTQRLISATNPENGTVSYTYNADGTVATKIDAKGNKEAYTYDSYQRLTAIHRYPGGVNEDPCQLQSFSYDGAYPGQLVVAAFGQQVSSLCGQGPNQLSFQYQYS